MSEEEKKDGMKPESEAEKPRNDDPLSALSPEARKIFEETQSGLLSALQKEREAAEQATKRIAAMEKVQREAETKRLKESDDYKGLYEKAQAELSEVKPKADRADSMEQALKEDLEAQIAAIPEDRRSLIPTELPVDAQLKWISRNRPILSKAQPMDIGAGRQGGEGKTVELTAEQQEQAKKLGVKLEDYANNLK